MVPRYNRVIPEAASSSSSWCAPHPGSSFSVFVLSSALLTKGSQADDGRVNIPAVSEKRGGGDRG